MAFLVTLGIISASELEGQATWRDEPVAQTAVEQRLESRRMRISLTNAWLRSLREVHPDEVRTARRGAPLTVAEADPGA
jgi:hypothetical protein